MLLVRVRLVGFLFPVPAGLAALPETSLVARQHATNSLRGTRLRLAGGLPACLCSRGLAEGSRRGTWNEVCHGNADGQTGVRGTPLVRVGQPLCGAPALVRRRHPGQPTAP